MDLPLEILKELYRWIKKSSRKQKILEIRPYSTSNYSNRHLTPRVGAKIQQDSGEVLVAHGAWLSYQIHWTSYWKELQAIHLGIIAFARVCKELQITNLQIRSDNSIAVFDLKKLRATDTLAPAVKEIYLTCQHLNMKIITQYVPGKINIIADAQSRLFRSGDYNLQTYYLNQIGMIWNIQLTLDLFASSTTKLLPRYLTANIRDQYAQWIDAFSNIWTNEILLVHSPIPIMSRLISYLNNDATLTFEIGPWWSGQQWITSLMNQSSRYLIFEQSSQCLIKRLSKENQQKLFSSRKDSSIPHGPVVEMERMLLTQNLDRIGLSRTAQQLLINGQKFETQRDYLYSMRTQAEFSYEHVLNIDQLLSISSGFLLLEVINWFIRCNPIVFSVNTLQFCQNSMLSFIFDIQQITSTPQKLAYRAGFKLSDPKQKIFQYVDIRQLFDYWRSRPDDNDLSDTKIQTKLASLLIFICFIRINETAEINLAISNIDYKNKTAILCLSPKANNSIEQYEIRRTGDPKVCPNSTLFTWLNRLYWHYGIDFEYIANLFLAT
ncbi:MAG: hypothetical protein EZS28_008695 [Streblomastix strix]|uniref:Uncharacterized protein n=1 Tax=Streblomastix strix TaxID=222440 RepID=A0A5J4WN22_9EUKA|nr:MAG: hypothetical protein EZS28_008695 [Streblomastix strix]